MFCMTRAARALEIACDSRKQKLYRLNRPLESPFIWCQLFENIYYKQNR